MFSTFLVGPDQKLEKTQDSSLKCRLGQPAPILLDSAVLVVRPADVNKRRVQPGVDVGFFLTRCRRCRPSNTTVSLPEKALLKK